MGISNKQQERATNIMFPQYLAVLLLTCIAFQGTLAAITVNVSPLVEVELGKPLEIPCTYKPSIGNAVNVQWFIISKLTRLRIIYKDMNEFLIDDGTDYSDRINKGTDFTLMFNTTMAMDERDFICQVSAGPAGVGEATASVKVFSAPKVDITASTLPVLVNKQLYKIGECLVQNAYPEPNITWYKGSVPLLPSADVKVTPTVTKETDGTFTVTSVLNYKPQKSDVRAKYHCEVNYKMPGSSKAIDSEKINVTMHYPPEKVNLIIESPSVAVKEGDTVVFRCETDGFPLPEIDFYQSLPAKFDFSSIARKDRLTLPAVNRNNTGTYGCHAFNPDWMETSMNSSKDLVVNYLDDVKLTPSEPIKVMAGVQVQVTCATPSSSGIPTYTWTKAGKVVSNVATLNLPSAKLSDMGEYSCVASLPSVPGLERSSSVKVTVEGKPTFNDSKDHKETRTLGDTTRLVCIVSGNPRPVISWEKPLDSGEQNDSWDEATGVLTSVVMVKVSENIPPINCTATNNLGQSTKRFYISTRLGPTTAPPGPTTAPPVSDSGNGRVIIAIIVSLLLVAVLGSFIYWSYKTKKFCFGQKRSSMPPGSNGASKPETEKLNSDNAV
ncbi:CD166 antigen-like isoform X1 [Petromyzon marinus]|uniref:CD166 antigen-like isoform X1 n=1 Tax=Petromyzon marinus TaxID=7757 RepID=UPI003F6FE939